MTFALNSCFSDIRRVYLSFGLQAGNSILSYAISRLDIRSSEYNEVYNPAPYPIARKYIEKLYIQPNVLSPGKEVKFIKYEAEEAVKSKAKDPV